MVSLSKLKNFYKAPIFNFGSKPISLEKMMKLDDFFNDYCCYCISYDECDIATILELGGDAELENTETEELYCEYWEEF